jgi:RHS repeat-associated protein
LDEALAGVGGYSPSDSNSTDGGYKNHSANQADTLSTAHLTSSNTPTPNHPPATINYYHCDQIGTPRELTDEQGAVTWSATYKAWGKVETERSYAGLTLATRDGEVTSGYANANTGETAQTHQALRFQGQYYDVETGLHYNRSRYYDHDLGRFLTPDPLGLMAGTHSFRYAPNPVGYVDPLGLDYRSTFWNAAGQLHRDKYQVHHIIPQAVWEKHQAFFNCMKMDKDSMSNLIGLPKTPEAVGLRPERQFGTSLHNSKHDAYSTEVDAVVTRISNSNMTCRQKKVALAGMRGGLRAALKQGTPLMKNQGSTDASWISILRG